LTRTLKVGILLSQPNIMNDEQTIMVKSLGWEWTCPKCNTLNSLSGSEYEDGFPVTCEECFEEYGFTEIYYW
jgi:hypothetical protein